MKTKYAAYYRVDNISKLKKFIEEGIPKDFFIARRKSHAIIFGNLLRHNLIDDPVGVIKINIPKEKRLEALSPDPQVKRVLDVYKKMGETGSVSYYEKRNYKLKNNIPPEYISKDIMPLHHYPVEGLKMDIKNISNYIPADTPMKDRKQLINKIMNKEAQEVIHEGDKGLSSKKHITSKDVDSKELKAGIKIEREHSSDPKVQKQIALDHLTEFPNYYTGLEKMEKSMSKAAQIMEQLLRG